MISERMSIGGDRERSRSSATVPASLLRAARAGPARLGGDRIIFVTAWIAMIVVFGIELPGIYLTTPNISTMLASQANILVLALATLLPLTCGDFDLSVASVSGLSAILLGVLNGQHHMPILLAILIAVLAGMAIGVINCFLVVVIGAESIVVTLGMATFLGGLVLWLSRQTAIAGISTSLTDAMIGHRLFDIPYVFYYALALCLILWFVQSFTVLGRRLLFVGQNRDVARLSGVRVNRLRMGSLIVGSGIAALSGIVAVGVSGAADPNQAPALLLPAFAAAFLGAAAIGRGRFNAWSCFLAVYFLIFGITGVQQLGAQSYVQDIFYGAALALAVTMARLSQRRRDAKAGRRVEQT
jgi:ribose transport system permease protein